MKAAWHGTVAEFIKTADEGVLVSEIQAGYQRHFKKVPGASEISSWGHSAGLLRKLLNDQRWHGLRIYFEYPMPDGEKRADVIFLGGKDEAPQGLVLELKRWDRFDGYVDADKRPPRRIRLYKGGGKTSLHPLLQARRYAMQLESGSRVGSRFSWSCIAVLPNMPIDGIKALLATKALPADAQTSLFGSDDYQAGLIQQLSTLVPAGISFELGEAFNSSGYAPSTDLIGRITENASALISSLNSVTDVGIEPTEAQKAIATSVLDAVRRHERKLFLVEGGPGSGKTLIAVLLLLRALAAKRNAKLAVYSSRLLAVIEDSLDSIAEGGSALVMSAGALPYQIRPSELDLLICDEAQRLSRAQIDKLLNRGKTVVMFYDERQRLNPSEEGTKQTFHNAAARAKFAVIEEKLEQMLRCAGGDAYHEWVEKLITGDQSAGNVAKQNWSAKYSFEVVDTCAEMLNKLRGYGANHKVVTVASFTCSPGDWNDLKSAKNIRYHDERITLYWWMYDHEYIEPWTYGRAADLDRVCSIYGAQGFESDYVGILWGSDFVYRNGAFIPGDSSDCFDVKGINNAGKWHHEAKELLQNRYRIFLTRGRLGTIIFAEDTETLQFLKCI